MEVELDQIDGELSDEGDDDGDETADLPANLDRIDAKHSRDGGDGGDDDDDEAFTPLHVLPLYSNLATVKQAKVQMCDSSYDACVRSPHAGI